MALNSFLFFSTRRTPIHTLSRLLCDSTAFRKETETNEKNDLKEQHCGTSLGGPVVKNLSANAGNRGWSPDLGRSHVPKSNSASGPQLLKPVCSRAQELQLTAEARVPQGPTPQQENHRSEKARHRSWRAGPPTTAREEPGHNHSPEPRKTNEYINNV